MLKNIFYIFILRLALAFLILLVDVIISRHLGVHLKGEFSTAISLISIVSIIFLLGGDSCINVSGHDNKKNILTITIYSLLISTALFLLFLFIINQSRIVQYNFSQNLELIYFSFLFSYLLSVLSIFSMALATEGRAILYLIARIIYRILVIITILLAFNFYVIDLSEKIIILIIKVNIFSLTIAIFFTIFLVEKTPINITNTIYNIKAALAITIQRLAEQLSNRLPILAAIICLDEFATGLTSVALSVSEILYLFSSSIASFLLSKKISNTHLNVIKYILPLLLLMALLAGLLSQFIIPLLWGKDFKNSSTILLFLIPGIVNFSIIQILTPYFYQAELRKELSITYIVNLTIGLLTFYPLSVFFEVYGIAISYSLSSFFSLYLALSAIKKKSGIKKRYLLVMQKNDIHKVQSFLKSFSLSK